MRLAVPVALAIASGAAAPLAPLAPSTRLAAQGSLVDQQGACMTSRVGAGVAMPCADGSAVYFNPAALARQSSVVSGGASLIRSGNTFRYYGGFSTDDRTIRRETESVPVPQAFASWRASPRLALGLGAWAPYGLTLEWPVCGGGSVGCTGANFEGRYTGYDNSLRGIYIQPTVAYQLLPDRLSVGAGVDVVRGSIEVHQRADAAQLGLFGVDIADVGLDGKGWGVTGHVGVQAQLTPRLAAGLRYLRPVSLDIDGDATFRQLLTGVASVDALIAPEFAAGGSLVDGGVKTTIKLPGQLVVGLAFTPIDALRLAADYQLTEWKSFDRFELRFANAATGTDELNLNYRNANTWKFGAEWDATPALLLRGGFRYNTAATPRATPFLPEGERNYFALGLGYRLTSTLGVDAAWQFIKQPDREGAVRPDEPVAGVYSATGQVFGLTLSWRFRGADGGPR